MQRGYVRSILAADHYLDVHRDIAMPNHELLEIYRGKISLHHAKTGYNYETIRLPTLTIDAVKSKLKTIATTRNWRTVNKLLVLSIGGI